MPISSIHRPPSRNALFRQPRKENSSISVPTTSNPSGKWIRMTCKFGLMNSLGTTCSFRVVGGRGEASYRLHGSSVRGARLPTSLMHATFLAPRRDAPRCKPCAAASVLLLRLRGVSREAQDSSQVPDLHRPLRLWQHVHDAQHVGQDQRRHLL